MLGAEESMLKFLNELERQQQMKPYHRSRESRQEMIKRRKTQNPSEALRTPLMGLAMLATLGLVSCVSGPRIAMTPPVCSERIPPQVRSNTDNAPLPTRNEIGEWVAFGDAQTAVAETERDKKHTSIWIVENCEREYKKAADSVNRRWFEFWK